ncbi:hypothetical protein WG66_000018 [Moniliophthora roreri]|nr:hypothetical protein WG66_000018 [Moniliophthora roreri]
MTLCRSFETTSKTRYFAQNLTASLDLLLDDRHCAVSSSGQQSQPVNAVRDSLRTEGEPTQVSYQKHHYLQQFRQLDVQLRFPTMSCIFQFITSFTLSEPPATTPTSPV